LFIFEKKTMEQSILTIEEIRFQHKLELQEFQLVIHKLENKIAMLQALLQSRENPETVNF